MAKKQTDWERYEQEKRRLQREREAAIKAGKTLPPYEEDIKKLAKRLRV